MAKYEHYQLRETCPNPAGGPYRDITEPQMKRNVDIVTEELRHAMQRIVPLLLETHMGDVRKVAACLAMLGVSTLHDFMKDNRAEGQKPNLRIYDEMQACLVAECDRQQQMALATAMGLDPVAVAKGDVKIIMI